MFSNNHSSVNKSSLNSLNTPLKASVLLVTAIMLSACGSDSDNSYNLKDIFDGNPTVTPGSGDGATGGNTGATGGDTGATGGNTGATGGDTGATGGDTGATGGDTGATGGDTGATGGDTGATGGDTGATGGDTGATGGDTGSAPVYSSAAENKKSGVQIINIDAGAIGVFNTTSREFKINADSLVARADEASKNLLPGVTVTTSASGDSTNSNGFKTHDDSVGIPTSFGELPLTYSSVYKDFGTQMRIGHIDGSAALGPNQLPVNGVAVYGNETLTLPTEGSVSYNGDATYRKLGLGNAIEYGSSKFIADFAAKKVDGTLEFSKASNIDISATISGSQFSGKKGSYTTEGAFYGNDAKYIGGVYEGNDAQGTFGAEKQSK